MIISLYQLNILSLILFHVYVQNKTNLKVLLKLIWFMPHSLLNLPKYTWSLTCKSYLYQKCVWKHQMTVVHLNTLIDPQHDPSRKLTNHTQALKKTKQNKQKTSQTLIGVVYRRWLTDPMTARHCCCWSWCVSVCTQICLWLRRQSLHTRLSLTLVALERPPRSLALCMCVWGGPADWHCVVCYLSTPVCPFMLLRQQSPEAYYITMATYSSQNGWIEVHNIK